MTRRSRIAVVVIVLAAAGWWGASRLRPDGAGGAPGGAPDRASDPSAQRTGATRGSGAPAASPARRPDALFGALRGDGEVTIAGRVIDVRDQQPVAGAEVVFRGAAGEHTALTQRDGAYSIRVASGTYRAFVRDDSVLSIGRADLVRLPALPSAETAGVPDEALMALVVATSDSDGVDLSVVRGGAIAGRVVDRSGRAVAGAVVRARGGATRPTLGTDTAETDATGRFELRVQAGTFDLEASHPRFAGVASAPEARVTVEPGRRATTTIELTAGCVIAGRVVGRDGKPAGDGAIEKQWGEGELQYAPAGRVEPDGTFRWTTTDEGEVTLRAWPWKSPPSPGRRFGCRDGARHEAVVFQLPDRSPDLEGVLVDRAGQPVAFAFVDLAPLESTGIAQQERTDATGHWAVYQMPPGRYRVTAQAEGRGLTTTTIASPRTGVRLELGGTGRLEGTTARVARGSFELVLGTCSDGAGMIALPQSRRVVSIAGGRFTVDDLPACELSFGVLWHGRLASQRVTIPSGGSAHVELDLGPPRAKTVHGVVRDAGGKPVAGASVVAIYQGTGRAGSGAADPEASSTTGARSDASGAYTVKTFSTAMLRASAPGLVGVAQVGAANVDTEQVDIELEDAANAEVDD